MFRADRSGACCRKVLPQRSALVCAGELKQCAQLRSLSVESNRLATPLLDLRPLVSLRSLQLFGNPLEYLPELSHCTALRHLSLANVRISADQVMCWASHIGVEPSDKDGAMLAQWDFRDWITCVHLALSAEGRHRGL